MNRSFQIAKTELKTLFYSPIAWVILFLFLFQCAFAFLAELSIHVRVQESGFPSNMLTARVFLGDEALFPVVANSLYLYIPLLTMGLISRELQSGTIKLLLSSPLKVWQILLGKYLAMLAYNLLFVLVLGLFILAGNASIISMDIGCLLAGLLGIYLLAAVFSAIGLFISSLTSYQIVAAVGTLAILAVLNFIGRIGQRYDVFRETTDFLSMSGRTLNFRDGLISTSDLFYFLIIAATFLFLASLRLYDGRQSISGFVKAIRYGLVLIAMILFGFVTSRPALTGYLDLTRSKRNTISQETQALLKKLPGPLNITFYGNILDGNFFWVTPEMYKKDSKFWLPYQRFAPDLKLDYVRYYSKPLDTILYRIHPGLSTIQIVDKVARGQEFEFKDILSPAELSAELNLKKEESRTFRLLRSGNKTATLRLYNELDVHPGDVEIAAALKLLASRPAKIGVVVGHNERSLDKGGDREYRLGFRELTYRQSLINQGFEFSEVNPELQPIPKDLSALVLADPTVPLSPLATEKIKNYLRQGGDILIAGEPGRQHILNPILSSLGIELSPGTMVQRSKDFAPDYIQARLTRQASSLVEHLLDDWKDSAIVVFSGAAAVSYAQCSAFTVKPIVVSNFKDTCNEQGNFAKDTGNVSFNAKNGDNMTQAALAISLSRRVNNKEQRILIAGDADFLSNRYVGSRYNGSLHRAIFSWFSKGQYPVQISRKADLDNLLKIGHEELGLMKLIFYGVLPTLILCIGSVILIRRNRK